MRQGNKFFRPFDENQEEKEEKPASELFVSKYVVAHYQKIDSLQGDLMRVPTPEEFFFLQSDTAFNAFDFVLFVAKTFPVKELHASTYSISRKVIDGLVELHDKGIIERVTLLVSDSMIKRNPVTIDHLMSICNSRPNFNALYAWSHAKVCLLRTHDFHFVVEGSGNFSDNAHYEQYVFANSKGLYDFRMELFTNVNLKKY